MRTTYMIAAVCIGLAAAVGAAIARQGAQPPAAPMDKKAVNAMIAAQGAPGPEHAELESFIGEFDTEIAMTMGPGMQMKSKATMKSEWVLGKRFVEVKSVPAEGEELKVESLSYFGFDKRTKKYFWIGMDSTDTYAVFAEGGYDAATKTFTLLGENLEPMMGGKVPFKTVIQRKDAGASTMAIWFQAKGAPGADADGWFKVVEMTKTPKKK